MADKETRRSRFFVYQDKKSVVIGKQSVRYEPNLQKDVFGTICVETFFPTRRAVKNGFPLSLYPNPENTNSPDKNIVRVEEGCKLLFIEANRSTNVQVRAVAKIKREDFNYSDIIILDNDKVVSGDENGLRTTRGSLSGVLTKDYRHLRKGDVVTIGDCIITKEGDFAWQCEWDPYNYKWTWKEYFRRKWIKLTDKATCLARYGRSDDVFVPVECIKLTSGKPVEPETIRQDKEG